jgi:hypothetical protein
MPSPCASGCVKAIDASHESPRSCRPMCVTRRTRGCWPGRYGGSPLLAGGSRRPAAAAGERDAAAGRRRGRLRRAVGDLVELLEATRQIGGPGRKRLAGSVPDGATRRVGLCERYDEHVSWGQTANRLRDWHNGSPPGYVLASRLKPKPNRSGCSPRTSPSWTNTASEQGIKGPKRHQAVSGCWHTRATQLLPSPHLPAQQPRPRHRPGRRQHCCTRWLTSLDAGAPSGVSYNNSGYVYAKARL